MTNIYINIETQQGNLPFLRFQTSIKIVKSVHVQSSEAKLFWRMTQLVFLWISPDHQIDFLLVLWSTTDPVEPFFKSRFEKSSSRPVLAAVEDKIDLIWKSLETKRKFYHF